MGEQTLSRGIKFGRLQKLRIRFATDKEGLVGTDL